MAINELITGSTPSSEFVPNGTRSECLVEASSDGLISLEMKVSGDWVEVTNQKGPFYIDTPAYTDTTYRFTPHGLSDNVRVFMNSCSTGC